MAYAGTTNAVVYILHHRGHFTLCYLNDFIRAAAKQATIEAYTDMFNVADDPISGEMHTTNPQPKMAQLQSQHAADEGTHPGRQTRRDRLGL